MKYVHNMAILGFERLIFLPTFIIDMYESINQEERGPNYCSEVKSKVSWSSDVQTLKMTFITVI